MEEGPSLWVGRGDGGNSLSSLFRAPDGEWLFGTNRDTSQHAKPWASPRPAPTERAGSWAW